MFSLHRNSITQKKVGLAQGSQHSSAGGFLCDLWQTTYPLSALWPREDS